MTGTVSGSSARIGVFQEPTRKVTAGWITVFATAWFGIWMAQLTPERGWAGTMSDQVWGYINRVALELNQSHPDRLVSGLAYSAYKSPPENIDKLSPNLVLIETRQRQGFWDEEKAETPVILYAHV